MHAVTKTSAAEREALEALALEFIVSAARLTRVVGKKSGSAYSSNAWRVLSDLERHGAQRVSDLAQQQNVAQPTMTALMQRLGSEGWVTREPDPTDGRATLVTITSRGAQALADYRTNAAAVLVPHLADLPSDDQVTLLRAAEIMHRIVEVA
ncbi:MarR family transcriptional regulator [Leucobacter sp. cx-328]|nr:MarR family transcriptional regulator [Leucobacter sp. cx-328]